MAEDGRLTPIDALGLSGGTTLTGIHRGMQYILTNDGRGALLPLDGIGNPNDPERGMFLDASRAEAAAALQAPLQRPLGSSDVELVYDATKR